MSQSGETTFPAGAELTLLLVVADLASSMAFYRDVVGRRARARVRRNERGVLGGGHVAAPGHRGGGPTDDKPTVTFTPPTDPDHVSAEMTFRVADCRATYAALRARGAIFLTPPVDHGYEVRCFFRDPDGHLLELSEVGP